MSTLSPLGGSHKAPRTLSSLVFGRMHRLAPSRNLDGMSILSLRLSSLAIYSALWPISASHDIRRCLRRWPKDRWLSQIGYQKVCTYGRGAVERLWACVLGGLVGRGWADRKREGFAAVGRLWLRLGWEGASSAAIRVSLASVIAIWWDLIAVANLMQKNSM